MEEVLEIENLSVSIDTPKGKVQAVREVSFSLHEGEVLALVGESGCGKSMLCKSIMKLLPPTARIEGGRILANGQDISSYSEREMQRLRGRFFSFVFQDPMTALNPTLPIGQQIAEAILVHQPKLSRQEVKQRVIQLMELVGIREPEESSRRYPYHFSGGMRQRSVMAIALAANPRILLADEPTTALDVTIQAQILDLLRDIQAKMGTATILVSHDLGVVARAADRVAIMYAGRIVEIGTAEEIYYDPRHPYTWGLLQSLPALNKGSSHLRTIPGMPPSLIHPPKGDAFACRNAYALEIDYQEAPPMFQISDTHYAATWLLDPRAPQIPAPQLTGSLANRPHSKPQQGLSPSRRDPVPSQQGPAPSQQGSAPSQRPSLSARSASEILLDVRHLTHGFRLGRHAYHKAVDDLSFQMRKGEILGLVGESGSGKSTLARCIMNVYQPEQGSILYKGINTCDKREYRKNHRMLEADRQIIFQDSASSLNQRMKVADIVAEPMSIHHRTPPRGSLRAEAEFQLHYVGIDPDFLDKYPGQLSGGQRQRVSIARALSMEPGLLVADEPVASLDVSIQAQIINLFQHLREEHGFSILFIAHDLAMVEYLCDRVGVMYRGKLVELAPTKDLYANPLHPYTKALLSAIPQPDPRRERKRKQVNFDALSFEQEGVLEEVMPEHFLLRREEEA